MVFAGLGSKSRLVQQLSLVWSRRWLEIISGEFCFVSFLSLVPRAFLAGARF